jgi:exodeoxyribonuclease-3
VERQFAQARLSHLFDWLAAAEPDVVLLQETKCVNEEFPRLELESQGWHLAIRGQKTYNGVAILSRHKIVEEIPSLDGDDGESRYIEAKLDNGLRVASIYVPMGQSTESDRFPFKLHFLDSIHARAKRHAGGPGGLRAGRRLQCGPRGRKTCSDVSAMEGQVLFHPEERARYRKLRWLGLTDAFQVR